MVPQPRALGAGFALRAPNSWLSRVTVRESHFRHRERKLRHRYAIFAGAEFSKDRAWRGEDTPYAPRLPRGWNEEVEVPYALKVGTVQLSV